MIRGALIVVGALAGCAPTADMAPPPTLVLSGPTFLYTGSPYAFVVDGLQPGQLVTMYATPTSGGPSFCPSILFTTCLDIFGAVERTGTEVADGQGRATFTEVPPQGIGEGYLQAATRNGSRAVLSNVLAVTVVDPNADDDGDGLTNQQEIDIYGTDYQVYDTDGGGVGDGDEVTAGTDPFDPSDDFGPPLGTWPCLPGEAAYTGGVAYTDIQAALNASNPGDIVDICAGTWVVSNTLRYNHAGPLTIQSNNGNNLTTVLSGGDARRILQIPVGSTTFVRNLGFVDGFDGYSGGAIDAYQVEYIELDGCRFEDNYADYEAGAVELTHATNASAPYPVVVRNSVFRNNATDYEAGALGVGIRWDPIRALIESSVFEANQASYEGGAMEIATSLGEVVINGCVFIGNEAGSASAFEVSTWAEGSMVVENSAFLQNMSNSGSAIEVPNLWTMEFVNVDLGSGPTDNQPNDVQGCAPQGPGSTFSWDAGAGIYCQ